MIPFIADDAEAAIPIWPISKQDHKSWLERQPEPVRNWLKLTGFKAEAGSKRLIADADGALAGVALGLGESPDLWCYGDLAKDLPAATYRLDGLADGAAASTAMLGWTLGGYAFTRYRARDKELARLMVPKGADTGQVRRTQEAVYLVRDLINTPASDLGPAELAGQIEALGDRHGATVRTIVGDDLLAENYPAVHAVGRASAELPRLVDMIWGPPEAPKLTLVGKGVCFDSGGLDIKPAAGMLRMKKDMGGAANVLGLAAMIMDAGLEVRLRVLVPAVENAISGTAFRPGDILSTRKGKTVEIGNTDAEGRLILCDALAEADSEEPDLLLDMATLTGAARVAVGPDLPALFTADDELALALSRHGERETDPLWRLPLYQPYAEGLKSRIADLNNVADSPMAGSVTAALFLKSFVTRTKTWAHLDLYAWNDKARRGRPVGGEAQAIRGIFRLLQERFG